MLGRNSRACMQTISESNSRNYSDAFKLFVTSPPSEQIRTEIVIINIANYSARYMKVSAKNLSKKI